MAAAVAAALSRLERNEPAVFVVPPVKVACFAGFVELAVLASWSEGNVRDALALLDQTTSTWTRLGTARYIARTQWAAALIAVRAGHPSASRRLDTAARLAQDHRLDYLTRRIDAAATQHTGHGAHRSRD